MTGGSGYEMLLPFDTDDAQFVRGFEAGRLWERMKNDHTDWDETIHGSNAEMVLRMTEVCERTVRSEEMGDDWIMVYVS